MSNTIPSPNMSMPIPVVSVDPGPDWATNINASLSIVDLHSHAPGFGVQVTPQGLDINSDLTMGSNNLIDIRTSRFTAQSAALSLPADIDCLYVAGVDLYYNDGAGNQIRITQGGSVTGSSGTITGLPSGTASASYSAGTFTFQGATLTPATMAVGPLVIGRAAASSKTVTVAPNAAQASNFNMTLPVALPGASNYMTLDNTGQLAFNNSGSTGSGAVVLATSPTLVTPTLTTPTITTASITLDSGSVSSPSLAFTGSSSNTGLYLAGTDILGFAANGLAAGSVSALGAWSLGTSGSTQVNVVNGPVSIKTAGSTNSFPISGDVTPGVWLGNLDGTAQVAAIAGTGTGNQSPLQIVGRVVSDTSASDAAIVLQGQTTSNAALTTKNIVSVRNNGTVVGGIGAAGLWTLGAPGGSQTHVANGSLSVTAAAAVGTTLAVTGATTLTGLATLSTGAQLPSSGATPSTLDFYATSTQATTFTFNSSSNTFASTLKFTRVGNVVTVLVPTGSAGTATAADSSITTAAAVIPSWARTPNGNTTTIVAVTDNSSVSSGQLRFNTDGSLFVSKLPATNFTGGSNSGFTNTVCVTYLV